MTARPDWKELSEATGLRVLTFPDGSTLTAADITGVRVEPGAPAHPGLGVTATRPRVEISLRCVQGRLSLPIYDEIEAVFAMATEAHRRAVQS